MLDRLEPRAVGTPQPCGGEAAAGRSGVPNQAPAEAACLGVNHNIFRRKLLEHGLDEGDAT
jgi:hypothetical protein